jgi:hypothetical protein
MKSTLRLSFDAGFGVLMSVGAADDAGLADRVAVGDFVNAGAEGPDVEALASGIGDAVTSDAVATTIAAATFTRFAIFTRVRCRALVPRSRRR